MPESTVSQRFCKVIAMLVEAAEVSSGADFMKRAGKSPTTFPNIVNGRQEVTLSLLEYLADTFKVRAAYLLQGTGDMFELSPLEKALAKAGRTPAHVPIGGGAGSGGGFQVLAVPVDISGEECVTVVSERALASYAEGFADPDFIAELPLETVPEDLRGRGTIRKFQVYGDSMEPTFHHGDYVYCSYVELSGPGDLLTRLRNEYVYVLNTTRGLFLKRVFYHPGDEFLQLYSDKFQITQDKKYIAFALPLEDIRELWYFRRRYTAQAPHPETDASELISLRRDLHQTQTEISDIKKAVAKLIGKHSK